MHAVECKEGQDIITCASGPASSEGPFVPLEGQPGAFLHAVAIWHTQLHPREGCLQMKGVHNRRF